MEWWQIIGLVLGSSVLTKLIDVWMDRRKRKDVVEDRAMAEDKNYAALEKKLTDFMTEQKKVNEEMSDHMQAIDISLKVVIKSSKAIQYSNLWAEAMGYVKQGSIDPEARVKFKSKVRDYIETFGEKRDIFGDVMAEIDELKS